MNRQPVVAQKPEYVLKRVNGTKVDTLIMSLYCMIAQPVFNICI